MADAGKLPRATNPDEAFAVPGRIWNQLCDKLEAIANLTAVSPLSVTRTPSGTSLSIRFTGQTVSLKLTATEGSGLYTARAFMGSVTGMPSTNGASLPSGLLDPGYDNALVMDPGLSGGTNSTTMFLSAAPTSTSPQWVTGLLVGVTNENPPRGVYELSGGGMPLAQYPGEVLISKADHSWSAGFIAITESNEGV